MCNRRAPAQKQYRCAIELYSASWAQLTCDGTAVILLILDRADGADFGVAPSELTVRVQQGVDMQTRGCWPPSELAEPQYELFLKVIGKVVLGAKENNTSLGDGDGEVTEQLIRVGRFEPLNQVGMRKLSPDNRCHIKRLM